MPRYLIIVAWDQSSLFDYLRRNFDGDEKVPGFSWTAVGGSGGSRSSHTSRNDVGLSVVADGVSDGTPATSPL